MKKLNDDHAIEPCLHLRLRQANRVLTNHYDEYLREVGITVTQFSILRALWYMKQTSQKELQKVLVLQQTTLTRNLKPLQTLGYLHTKTSEEDRRVSLVSLTDDGKTVFKRARQRWDKAQKQVVNRLGESCTHDLFHVTQAIIRM